MTERQPHPMEALLLHVAKKLRDQYSNLEERDEFTRLIADAEECGASAGAKNAKAEQGKLPSAPEVKTDVPPLPPPDVQ